MSNKKWYCGACTTYYSSYYRGFFKNVYFGMHQGRVLKTFGPKVFLKMLPFFACMTSCHPKHSFARKTTCRKQSSHICCLQGCLNVAQLMGIGCMHWCMQACMLTCTHVYRCCMCDQHSFLILHIWLSPWSD